MSRTGCSWTTTTTNSKSSPNTTGWRSVTPKSGDDDDWERKLEVVADLHPELVSFTFGVPSPDVIARLGALGMLVMVTVTSAYEAGVAVAAGADSLVVQGPMPAGTAARSHRTWTPEPSRCTS